MHGGKRAAVNLFIVGGAIKPFSCVLLCNSAASCREKRKNLCRRGNKTTGPKNSFRLMATLLKSIIIFAAAVLSFRGVYSLRQLLPIP